MEEGSPRVIVITGATACGKSSFGMQIAESLGGEILNADSVQVYRGFDIGSSKPSADDFARVPHHLYSIKNAEESFDAAQFRSAAVEKIGELSERKVVPIVVGGTGLYIKTLLCGLVEVAAIDEGTEHAVQTQEALFLEQDAETAAERMHQWLKELDPETAERLQPSDRQRVRRALHVYLSSGTSLLELQREHEFSRNEISALVLHLELPRERLYGRINQRVEEMLAQGFVAEVESLSKKHPPASMPFRAIGYRQILQYLRDELSLEEMRDLIQRDTRRFAKRQLTWWRNEPKKLGWDILPRLESPELAEVLSVAREFVDKKGQFTDEGIAFLPISLENASAFWA